MPRPAQREAAAVQYLAMAGGESLWSACGCAGPNLAGNPLIQGNGRGKAFYQGLNIQPAKNSPETAPVCLGGAGIPGEMRTLGGQDLC